MKLSYVLPFVAASSALVLPPEQVLGELEIEDNHGNSWFENAVAEKERFFGDIKETFDGYFEEVKEKSTDAWSQISDCSHNAFDEAYEQASNGAAAFSEKLYDTASTIESWLEEQVDETAEAFDGGHHGRPGHGRPGRGRRPHHPPHPHKSNLTVYEMIAKSKYTTKLAKYISEHPDLVEALNGTKANYTFFAPTDKAFAKIPDHAPKPSKEKLKEILSYHVVPEFYPAGRILVSHTAPTLFKSEHLSSEPEPQRITFRVGLRGVTLNFYSRIVAMNIFGTNGVIHGIDSLLVPPPRAIKEIDLFPGAFSTLELGLAKTGLLDKLNTTDHAGGTLFAPNNWAFQKLGPKVNAFLFSQYGLKYLKALLEYHVVPENTLYSDAYYKASSSSSSGEEKIPKGIFHVDLPTLLKDRSLSIDIARYGGFISMKLNGFFRVAVQDVPADDGVIHVMTNVIVPPKKLGGEDVDYPRDGEMSVEELVERLEPFVAKADL